MLVSRATLPIAPRAQTSVPSARAAQPGTPVQRAAYKPCSRSQRSSRSSYTLGSLRLRAASVTAKPSHVCQSQKSQVATVLLGDIGGTNARFEVVTADLSTGKREGKSYIKKYATKDYPTFQQAVRQLTREPEMADVTISSCCLAVAGPVNDNCCFMTNLDWRVDGNAIEEEFKFRTQVLNDFEAVGYGIPELNDDEILALTKNARIEGAPIAVVGPGTGLGEAQLMYDTGISAYNVWPSEGSHADFAPRGKLQRQLLEFAVTELQGPCEYEHVACGSGLERIYRFLCHDKGIVAEDLEPADVSMRGLKNECPICSLAVDVFLEIIGQEAGAMGLRSLAKGGIYIAGGIPPKLLPRIKDGNLMNAFLNTTGRFTRVLETFPVYVCLNEDVGLKGVYAYALALAKGQR